MVSFFIELLLFYHSPRLLSILFESMSFKIERWIAKNATISTNLGRFLKNWRDQWHNFIKDWPISRYEPFFKVIVRGPCQGWKYRNILKVANIKTPPKVLYLQYVSIHNPIKHVKTPKFRPNNYERFNDIPKTQNKCFSNKWPKY